MPCEVEPNGTEICLPLSSRRLCTGESTGTRMPLPPPVTLADSGRDEHAALALLLEGDAVQHRREVGHRAEVELVRDHLAGQRRTRGEVLPADLVVRVLVPAVVRQVLLQQLELADDEPAGRAVDRGVLRADGDADGLGGGGAARQAVAAMASDSGDQECVASVPLSMDRSPSFLSMAASARAAALRTSASRSVRAARSSGVGRRAQPSSPSALAAARRTSATGSPSRRQQRRHGRRARERGRARATASFRTCQPDLERLEQRRRRACRAATGRGRSPPRRALASRRRRARRRAAAAAPGAARRVRARRPPDDAPPRPRREPRAAPATASGVRRYASVTTASRRTRRTGRRARRSAARRARIAQVAQRDDHGPPHRRVGCATAREHRARRRVAAQLAQAVAAASRTPSSASPSAAIRRGRRAPVAELLEQPDGEPAHRRDRVAERRRCSGSAPGADVLERDQRELARAGSGSSSAGRASGVVCCR